MGGTEKLGGVTGRAGMAGRAGGICAGGAAWGFMKVGWPGSCGMG